MKWEIENVYTTVTGASDAENRWLRGYLSYVDTSYHPGKPAREDRRVPLYNELTGAFPTGFGVSAYLEAQRQDFKIEIEDRRVPPCQYNAAADLEWLRHHPATEKPVTHQIEAVETVAKRRRGIVWLPTGSGKTEIAIGISRALPCNWLFLVHRADLLQQTADRYTKRTGLPAGVIGDGKIDIPEGARFVVCMFQTANSALKRQGDPHDNEGAVITRRFIQEWAEGVIADECHAVAAETLYSTTMSCRNAFYRVGLSGTPLSRSDSKNLLIVAAIGPVIYRVMPETLIKLGILAKPTIRMITLRQQSERPTWKGVYGECIVRSEARNNLVVEMVRRAAKPALVFVQHVKHGKILLKELEEAGVPVEFTWGEKETPARRAAIERLMRNETQALICNVIFQEGVDIPGLRSVVVATGGQSTIATLQRMGRGMRTDAETGKSTFEVWDVADRGCGCEPDDGWGQHPGCKWLERHTKARIRAFKSEGYPVIEAEGSQQSFELDDTP